MILYEWYVQIYYVDFDIKFYNYEEFKTNKGKFIKLNDSIVCLI